MNNWTAGICKATNNTAYSDVHIAIAMEDCLIVSFIVVFV
jgi:hypothetical protein